MISSTYYVDFACPVGNVATMGSQTPLKRNPGCGDTPGPAGKPPRNTGGCPWVAGTTKIKIYINKYIISLD